MLNIDSQVSGDVHSGRQFPSWYRQLNGLKLIESVDEYLQATPIPTAARPADIISYAVWLYYRFNLSHRDIEDLLAERGMRRFKSVGQAQRFLGAHASDSNLFNLGRHLVRADHYSKLRTSAFTEWEAAVA